MSHRLPIAAFGAFVAFATVWVFVFHSLAARQVRPGENVIAVFPPGRSAVEAIGHLEAARPRQFEPLGFGNAWLVQAGATPKLAAVLKSRGAIAVLRAGGPLHFALGCTTTGPSIERRGASAETPGA